MISKVKYQIWFRDSLGWYCPGAPWTNPDEELLLEWKDECLKRKDVKILAFMDGKLCENL